MLYKIRNTNIHETIGAFQYETQLWSENVIIDIYPMESNLTCEDGYQRLQYTFYGTTAICRNDDDNSYTEGGCGESSNDNYDSQF